MLTRIGLFVTAAAVLSTGWLVPQRVQAPAFRGSTTLVAIDAVVRDSAGHPIRNLTRDDFQVLEDGQLRDLQTCTLIDLPVTDVGARVETAARQVASNARDGRVYLIAIDAFHLTPAGAHRIAPLLKQFITDYMGPADVAAVARLDFSPRGSEFTSDKQRLLSLVGAANVPSPSTMAPPGVGIAGGAPFAPAALINERMLASLASAMQYAARPQGRRTTVLLLSEGIDTDVFSAATGNDEALRTLDAERDAIEAAARANVNIYAIDPRGLAAMDSRMEGGRPVALQQWDSLRTLAAETGGRAIVGRTDLRDEFARLVAEDSTYYILGYVSPHADDYDGKFHQVTVRVRRSGASVDARKGWYAPKRKEGKTAAALNAAWFDNSLDSLLARPLPTGNLGVTLRATGATVRLGKKQATVVVVLEGSAAQLPWQRKAGEMQARLQLAYRTIADDGKELRGGPQSIVFRRTAPGSSGEGGWRYVGEVTLGLGHTQLRVAVRAPDDGRAGSVFLDLAVPDPARTPLVLSDLLLTSRLGAMPTTGRAPGLEGVLPGPPTTARTFSRDDTLVVYAHLAGKQAKGATVHSVVRAVTGAAVRSLEPQVHDLTDGARDYVAVLPLGSFEPGEYVLTFEATASKADPVSKAVSFTVR
ncbi:MAG TPA: VWA domain-containing protein [Vicinamibacterales bacterium]|nr:VWA domain-containing protein [Vicinamibacterales bacterium]